MAQTVVGLFDNAAEAQQAVQQLIDKGFSHDDIDVSTSSASTGYGSSASGISGADTTTSGYSTSGTGLGSETSGTLGSGSFSSDSSLSSSGTNSSLTGSSASSASGTTHEGTGSGIGRFFKSLFGDDDNEADRYAGVAQHSNAVVTVHAKSSDEAEQAADILDDAGAINVDERAAQYGYSSGNTSSSASNATNLTSDTAEGATSIPIIEEELQVGKRTVQTGGARLRSRIVERPVEESLRLREERVRVERDTVNRPATEADFAAFKEGTIEMTESAEVPVVSKEARVVEEVSLGKEVEERQETIRDTVRNTEVEVENLTNENLSNRSSTNDLGGTGTGTSGTSGVL